jgi:hypothetical protein
MPDVQLDARIRADRIDILFDLSGHSAAVAPVCAQAGAVQIMDRLSGHDGLSAIDYRLLTESRPRPDASTICSPSARRICLAIRLRSAGQPSDVAEPPMLGPEESPRQFHCVSTRSASGPWSCGPGAERILGISLLVGRCRINVSRSNRGTLRRRRYRAKASELRLRLTSRRISLHDEVDILLDTAVLERHDRELRCGWACRH